jgi:hypothetical protein
MKPPEEIFRALLESGNDMADRSYEYRLLDDATKSVLAQITLEVHQAEGCSMSQAKEMALACSDYRNHLKASAEASRIAERAKIRYYSTKSYADHCRTAEASNRAAMSSAP